MRHSATLINYINTNYSFADEYLRYTGHKCPTHKMMCLWHNNSDSPAAAYYPDSNVCHCFVCGKNYGVYDLWRLFDPQKIDEVNSTVILPTMAEQYKPKNIQAVKIDRSLPLSEIYKTILEYESHS